MTRSQEKLLFTIAKILRKELADDPYNRRDDLAALDEALRDFVSYIPYQEALSQGKKR